MTRVWKQIKQSISTVFCVIFLMCNFSLILFNNYKQTLFLFTFLFHIWIFKFFLSFRMLLFYNRKVFPMYTMKSSESSWLRMVSCVVLRCVSSVDPLRWVSSLYDVVVVVLSWVGGEAVWRLEKCCQLVVCIKGLSHTEDTLLEEGGLLFLFVSQRMTLHVQDRVWSFFSASA